MRATFCYCLTGLSCVCVHTGRSALSSKSLSSSYFGGSSSQPGPQHDKSFEELRYEHLQEHPPGPGGCPLTLQGSQAKSLCVRWLWILGRLLDCQHIRSTVVELVRGLQ